ncbi:FAD-binding domain-containing protein [Aspergillus crustosus]
MLLPSWQSVLSLSSAAPNITQLFGPSLSAHASIHLPSDANYTDKVTQRWTNHQTPSYIGTIKPATIKDVQNTIKIAAAHDLPFLVTGGGHGASISLGKVQGGLQIDQSNFDSVDFDPTTNLLTVGGATRFSQIIDLLADHGKEFPIGTAPCVGLVGATLGAGVSSLQGAMGLLSDLLESVDLVTAAGETITASRTENPDLFWAIRGAGFNFGVVTSATYRVPEPLNNGQVVNANFMVFPTENSKVWQILESLDESLPSDLALNIVAVYNEQVDATVVLINANYYGPESEARKYLQPFFDLNLLQSEVLVVPWPKVFETSYFGIDDTKACGRDQHVNMYSIGANQTSPSTLSAAVAQLETFSRANKDVASTLVIHRFPTQAVLAILDEDSAQLESTYTNSNKDAIVDELWQSIRHSLSRTNGFGDLSVYVNFAHGDEGPVAWYSERKLERLSALKRKWDPNQLFSFYNAIPLDWSTGDDITPDLR